MLYDKYVHYITWSGVFLFTKTICVHHVYSVNGSLESENVRNFLQHDVTMTKTRGGVEHGQFAFTRQPYSTACSNVALRASGYNTNDENMALDRIPVAYSSSVTKESIDFNQSVTAIHNTSNSSNVNPKRESTRAVSDDSLGNRLIV